MVPGIMADDRNREGHASQEEGSEVHGLLPVTHHGVDAVCTSRGAGPWSARLGFSPGTASPSRRSPGRGFWNAGSGQTGRPSGAEGSEGREASCALSREPPGWPNRPRCGEDGCRCWTARHVPVAC